MTGEVDWSFESWDETFVAVRGRIRETSERGRVFQNPADEEECHLTQSSVTVPGKQRLPVFPERHVGVHAGAVVGEERFRHEGDRFVMLPGDVADDVFVILHRVAHLLERREPNVDLGLAGGGDLVVLFVDWNAGFLQLERHFVANILQRVHRRDGKITFLRSNLVAHIRKFFARAVPVTFDAIDEMERRVCGVTEPHIVKNEKFGLGPEECGISDAGAL